MNFGKVWRSDPQAATGKARLHPWLRWCGGALLVALGWQGARLLMILFTSAGPLGPPALAVRSSAEERDTAARFDPFFRQSGEAASGVVTALPLKLFGTRIDFASGRGSAIIATPDGVQSSFLVGETIMPGAKLATVASDHVEIERNGTRERLYLDQSVPAPTATPAAPPPAAPGVVAPAPAPVQEMVTPPAPPIENANAVQ